MWTLHCPMQARLKATFKNKFCYGCIPTTVIANNLSALIHLTRGSCSCYREPYITRCVRNRTRGRGSTSSRLPAGPWSTRRRVCPSPPWSCLRGPSGNDERPLRTDRPATRWTRRRNAPAERAQRKKRLFIRNVRHSFTYFPYC